jgi:hypothetical protein
MIVDECKYKTFSIYEGRKLKNKLIVMLHESVLEQINFVPHFSPTVKALGP